MKNTLFFLSALLFIVLASCNDNKGGDDVMNYKTNKNKIDKDDNKDDFPNNRDEGMDRDYEDDSKNSIVGRWRFVDYESEDEEEMSEEDRRSMRSATVEFKRDGSFSSSAQLDGETKKTYGTYTYKPGSGILKTVEDDGREETMEIEFRGKNKVRLTVEGGTVTMERD